MFTIRCVISFAPLLEKGYVSTSQPGLYFCPVFVSGNLLQYLPLKSGYSECGIISMQLLDTTLSLESKSVSTWSSVADHQPLACNPSSSSCPPASSSPAPAKNFPGQELGKPAESEYQTGPTLEPDLVDWRDGLGNLGGGQAWGQGAVEGAVQDQGALRLLGGRKDSWSTLVSLLEGFYLFCTIFTYLVQQMFEIITCLSFFVFDS